MRLVVVSALAAATVLAAAGRHAQVLYQPPVDAPVVDPFRPPPSPFGPGNRGIDYATRPGTPVGAAAEGEVAFAGSVGGSLHVVVRHADGVRTSYSFLASVSVRRGHRVAAGQELGRSGPSLHFGARRGDVYIDPLTLFRSGPGRRVYLVPDRPSPSGPRIAPPSPRPPPVHATAVSWARRPVDRGEPPR